MSNTEDEIRSTIEDFAADVAAIVRRTALHAIASALGTPSVAAPARTVAAPVKRGRPASSAVSVPARPPGTSRAPSVKPSAKKTIERAPGEKRPPAELAKLVGRLGDYIKEHPGLRMEALGRALGKPTRELNLPIKKLLAAKRIRSQGQKRATEYFPG
jgi:hypothetical protein